MFLVCLHWLEKNNQSFSWHHLENNNFCFYCGSFLWLQQIFSGGAQISSGGRSRGLCELQSKKNMSKPWRRIFSLYSPRDDFRWSWMEWSCCSFQKCFKIPLVSSWSVPQIWKADENGSQNWAMLLKSLTQTWGASWSSWCHCGQSGVWVMWGKILYFLLGAPSQGDANAISYF